MTSFESAVSAHNQDVERRFTFKPNEETTGLGIHTRGFPLWRLEHIRGLVLPVARIRTHEGAPAAVEIEVGAIATALEVAGNPQAEWWDGLNLGLSYSDNKDKPTVILHTSGGTLAELPPELTE